MSGEDDFPPERTSVDGLPSFLDDPPTRRALAPCGWCGLEPIPTRDPRGPCEHCGRVPAIAREWCLGHGGAVLWLPALAQFDRPHNLAEALKIAASRDDAGVPHPVCVACPTWWVCTVAPGAWSG